MAKVELTGPMMELIAERFKALAEPTRLGILNTLRDGEMSVTELVDATGLGQANVSKHLQVLYSLGFVDRRKDGLHVYYRLPSEEVFQLCEIVCGRLAAEADRLGRMMVV